MCECISVPDLIDVYLTLTCTCDSKQRVPWRSWESGKTDILPAHSGDYIRGQNTEP